MYASAIPSWIGIESNDPKNVDAMLKQGVSEKIQSKWSSLVVLV